MHYGLLPPCRRRRASERSALAARRRTTASVPTSAGADGRITLDGLVVSDDPDRWGRIGFTVDAVGNCTVDGVRLVIEGGDQGVCAWSLAGVSVGGAVDGLATHAVLAPPGDRPVARAGAHANGVTAIDHVVVTSPDGARTVRALQAAGLEPRRTRAHGSMQQTFFRLGPVVLELVAPAATSNEGSARFWGIAFRVDDLDATAAFLGERLGQVKDAVQPGRRIASLRKEAGLAVPLAFMS
jgi:hypothetical protein